MDMFAVIRVRGIRKIKPRVKRTLELLRLHKPNHCVVVPENKSTARMLNIARDYVAYGAIGEKTLAKLLFRRGKDGSSWLREKMDKNAISQLAGDIVSGKKKLSAVASPVFCLHPPRKGYKSIKSYYPKGDLGRHEQIERLLNRMM